MDDFPKPVLEPPGRCNADELRARLLQRFEQLLDRALGENGPPQGLPPDVLAWLEDDPLDEDKIDLYSLWSALLALGQEIKLQSRSFHRLNDSLAPVAELENQLPQRFEALDKALAETRASAENALHLNQERMQEFQARERRSASKGLVELLADIRDRLERGLEEARAQLEAIEQEPRAGWLAGILCPGATRRAGQLLSAAKALYKGYRLAFERLEDELVRHHLNPIPCLGLPFDPRSMNAVDIEETDQLPEGTVVDVYRTGYLWNGEVLRPAEVKVSRGVSSSS